MKKAIVLCVLIFWGCFGTNTEYHVLESAPDLISRDSLRNSVHVASGMPIDHAGKIVSAGTYLYINEPYKGWHIIDNKMPASPKNIGFITVPGSLQGSVVQNYLYLNNSVDIIVLDLVDPAKPVVIRRLEHTQPEPVSPHRPLLTYDATNNTAIVGWHDTTVVEIVYNGIQ
jgi:hypothetical protein